MRTVVLALAALVAIAPAALAQDPPSPTTPPDAPAAPVKAPEKPKAPAKHENKVSPEAKAAFEAAVKAAYNPVSLGLKEIKGNLRMEFDLSGMDLPEEQVAMMESLQFNVEVGFLAPNALTITAKTDNPMLEQQVEGLAKVFRRVVPMTMGVLEPSTTEEFDAEVVTEKEAKVLVLKSFKGAEEQGTMRLTLGADGIPAKGTLTATDEMGTEQEFQLGFKYGKEGEKSRLESVSLGNDMMMEPMEIALRYADLGGFKLLSSMEMHVPMAPPLKFNYTELAVNGKKVELPKPKVEAPKAEGGAKPAGEGGKEEPKDDGPPPDGPPK